MDYIYFWIVAGIVAGMMANTFRSAEGPAGPLGDLGLGGIGGVAGGWLFNDLFGQSYGGWIGSSLVAFIGAVVLLFVRRAVAERPAVAPSSNQTKHSALMRRREKRPWTL